MKQYVRRNPDIIHAVQFTKPEDVQQFLANDQTLSAYVAEVCDVPHPMIDGLFLQTMVIRRKGQVFKTALFHKDWLVYEDGILKRFTDAEFHEKFMEKPQHVFSMARGPWGMGDSITVPPFKTSVTASTSATIPPDKAPFDPVKAADREFIRNEALELDRQMTDMMRKQREDLKRRGLDA